MVYGRRADVFKLTAYEGYEMKFKPGDEVVVVIDSNINTLREGAITRIVKFRNYNEDEGNVWAVTCSTQGYYESELELTSVYNSPLYKALR